MNWFDGPIMNAITESQTKKLIFLVYTQGTFLIKNLNRTN